VVILTRFELVTF